MTSRKNRKKKSAESTVPTRNPPTLKEQLAYWINQLDKHTTVMSVTFEEIIKARENIKSFAARTLQLNESIIDSLQKTVNEQEKELKKLRPKKKTK